MDFRLEIASSVTLSIHEPMAQDRLDQLLALGLWVWERPTNHRCDPGDPAPRPC